MFLHLYSRLWGLEYTQALHISKGWLNRSFLSSSLVDIMLRVNPTFGYQLTVRGHLKIGHS